MLFGRIGTYAYFLSESLQKPEVTLQMLCDMAENSIFDYFRYTDADGLNYAADGQTSDATDRDYYINGMQGKKGISVILESRITNETMVGFYAPIHYKDEIIGVFAWCIFGGEIFTKYDLHQLFWQTGKCVSLYARWHSHCKL